MDVADEHPESTEEVEPVGDRLPLLKESRFSSVATSGEERRTC